MIPVSEPSIEQADIDAVAAALTRGEISGNFGEALDQFELQFANRVGCRFGVATTSGTTALHLCLAAAGIGPGDEVIVSSSTNIATALAAVYVGATPIPADVNRQDWNIDLGHVASLITSRTKAIIPVHLFGNPVPMDSLMSLAETHGLLVVEDCAQAHGASWQDKPVGSFGHLAAFSFYANKIITTGEGGMATSNDEQLARRLRYLRNLAFTKPRFRHEEVGFNYRMTGYQAAMGLSQLDRLDHVIMKKRNVYATYHQQLGDIPHLGWQQEIQGAYHVHWMTGLRILPSARVTRDKLSQILHENGIETRTFFCPMNQQPCLRELSGYRQIDCPISDALWQDGIYLPSGPNLQPEQIRYISNHIRDCV